MIKGDKPGHEFHGNQHTVSIGGESYSPKYSTDKIASDIGPGTKIAREVVTGKEPVITSRGTEYETQSRVRDEITLPPGVNQFSPKVVLHYGEMATEGGKLYGYPRMKVNKIDQPLKGPAMKLFAQIKKVDQANRLVYGIAAAEEPDRAGEIMDYASSVPHFKTWSADVSKAAAAVGAESLGNVRAMHGKIAAGKLTQIEFNDAEKQIEVAAKIVDDAEWKKVEEGVYTGFSIGGRYVKQWDDASLKKEDGKTPITRYTAGPSELSLVDRPCIPKSNFFQVQKADGGTMNVMFKEKTEEETKAWEAQEAAEVEKASTSKPAGEGKPDDGDKGGKADVLSDKAKEATDVANKEKSKDMHAKAAEAHSKAGAAQKDAGNSVKADKHFESAKQHEVKAKAAEADDEKQKADTALELAGTEDEFLTLGKLIADNKLPVKQIISMITDNLATAAKVAALTTGAEALKKATADGKLKKGFYAVARLAEFVGQFDSMCDQLAAEQFYEGDTDSTLATKCKAICGALCDLLRDMVAEEAAEYADGDGLEMLDADAPLRKLKKATKEETAAHTQKLHDLVRDIGATCVHEKIAENPDLQKALSDAVARIAALEAQPMPSRINVRLVPVSKEDDARAAALASVKKIEVILNSDGTVNESASLIKAAQAAGTRVDIQPLP